MFSCFMKHSFLILAIFAVIGSLRSEAQGIPVYRADEEVSEDALLRKRAEELYSRGLSLPISIAKEQLSRCSCQLSLPQPHDRPMEGRALWSAARKSFVRVGYYYHCKGCKRWRLDLSCGFFLTEDGAVATAYHVLVQNKAMGKGCLIVIDDEGIVYPVAEIAAANKTSDVCILRVKTTENTSPLPLNEDARPGDRVFCFSDPMGERSYFSAGMVNRLAELPKQENGGAPPLMLDVSTDWAPGSSGAAVIDECGNAIGLVSMILALQDDEKGLYSKGEHSSATWMVVHEAVSARELKALIRSSDKGDEHGSGFSFEAGHRPGGRVPATLNSHTVAAGTPSSPAISR
jgi:S1-C subfamily serine protease